MKSISYLWHLKQLDQGVPSREVGIEIGHRLLHGEANALKLGQAGGEHVGELGEEHIANISGKAGQQNVLPVRNNIGENGAI